MTKRADTGWAELALDALRSTGHRSGGARQAVVELLAETDCCLSAQEIADELNARESRVGIASIYRAIDVLQDMGLVQRVDVGAGTSRYEAVVPGGDHHHHIVCDACGRISAFEDPASSGRSAVSASASVVAWSATTCCSMATARAAKRGSSVGGAILVAEALTVGFGDNIAISDLTVAIPRRSSVALLGPNGAGKSTLLQAAIGLVRPRSGSVRVASDRVAFVPQRLDVEPAFPVTARDVVRMGRYGDLGWLERFGARDHAAVTDAMEALGVAHLARRRFGDLSGGERQRVLLAQAIAQDAELLLLDEPFTGVDRPTHDAVGRLLADWSAEGRTVDRRHSRSRERRTRLRPRPLPQPPARRLRAAGRGLHRGSPGARRSPGTSCVSAT